ncbi:TetR/AcrR family transcriptional regulator [Mycolicibacterium komossense]|uniref:TetR family transcriptional regulator n=1 Tax=Mycolicibacterium komossense TaxID=1779 RepID=A0ABT3CF62_9MYCO|nr:TetR/AcrR family transcriptional regulator [Mycolicibacterium komossense]MCV7227881.1 TetR family transcriptional regulator [Mycolicibacterium komossense]
MSRWEPDAIGRLQKAALELFGERGFEPTTVADIAARAGLTERTYFRYFSDKREVLFAGSAGLQALLADAVAGAPESVAPIDAVATALDAVVGVFEGRIEHARQRQAVISANPSLQERELIKMAALSEAVAEALRGRGVGDPAATLTAEAGISVFKVAFTLWIDPGNQRSFPVVVRDTLAKLKAVTAE